MPICKTCVLDGNFPGITFNDDGVCIFCQQHKNREEQRIFREKYIMKFTEIIKKHKGKNAYDCIVAFSGGKDSTYTLYLLKKEFDLNILALSYDNWFQSETAHKNIKCVVENLKIDLLTITPSFEIFKRIIQTVVSNDIYSTKALERASSICTTCISLIRFMCFKVAIEKEIPMVIFGMSPGQAPVITSVVKTNPEMINRMQDLIYQPLYHHLGEKINPYFLEDRHFNRPELFPYSINPLAFVSYHEKDMIDIIHSLGWENPKDTDNNSTNCLLNAYANIVHKEKYHFHPYAFELAELVREGNLDRKIALERISADEDEFTINLVKNKLGIQ